ncbi:MAG: DUF4416 family protein [Desulfobacteraceae bacterium]|nr:MAG: DUF4416 family protein [Desulfobacteraceae bacterium]
MSLFSAEADLLEKNVLKVQEFFGPIDWQSPPLFFDRTQYYAKEMGWPLHRRFVTFETLIRPEALVTIKLKTNSLEQDYRVQGKRRINIDPGYIALERLVLATGKNYTHRIYLGAGIFADLTLVFNQGTFKSLPWTYRDYGDPEIIAVLNELRENYKNQVRGLDVCR